MWVAPSAEHSGTRSITLRGMRRMGFREYVPTKSQSHVITTYLFPDDPNFECGSFYQWLPDKSVVIYPGKLTDVECFRIGSIGRIYESDIGRC